MKTIKFIAHPLTIIISFLIILISGEQFGGFYVFYLLLGLSHGAAHSIAGVLGIALLLFGNIISKQSNRNFMNAFLNLVGCLLLWCSLFLFFFNDKSNYNVATFYQLLPLILLIIFLLTSISFFVENILLILKHSGNNIYKTSSHNKIIKR